MRNILWKLFPPYEVRLSIEEAHEFFAQNSGVSSGVIESAVVNLLKDAERTVYSIRIERMKPDHLVLMLTTNVIGSAISSGAFHTYRGILSFVGQDMLTLWHKTQSALLEGGYASQDEVEKDNIWIQEQVKRAG